jgi:hypothetical protein
MSRAKLRSLEEAERVARAQLEETIGLPVKTGPNLSYHYTPFACLAILASCARSEPLFVTSCATIR